MITEYLIQASFTQPVNIGVNAHSMLWILPLIATISIVYKTTKIQNIKFASFTKDIVVLFGSIIVFMAITAIVLYSLAWILTE